MRIILAEDQGWEKLRPLTWLRPAGALLVGSRSNLERWRIETGHESVILCRTEIAALREDTIQEPPGGREWRLWVRDRLIPGPDWACEAVSEESAAAWSHDGSIVAVRTERPAPTDCDPSSRRFWESLAEGTEIAPLESASLLVELSDLVSESTKRIEADLSCDLIDYELIEPPERSLDCGKDQAYEPELIHISEDCRVDLGAVLDARDGPIILGAGTVVFPHTWIRGPFGCRENCMLLGGRIGGGSYFGPECRVRGEVEASTFQGYVNKAHDGFVGHSYLGEWINLGALTTTSDLKNNYGVVRLDAYGRVVDTGQQKVGVFMGDHAKTRIGAMLNSGSVIGVAANVFGEASVFPKWIADFAWGVGDAADEYALETCLETVETVMNRRDRACSTELRAAIEVAFKKSRDDRKRFLGR